MWPNPWETADLVTFTEEILNGKLHFLCSGFATCRTCLGCSLFALAHGQKIDGASDKKNYGTLLNSWITKWCYGIIIWDYTLQKKWSFPLRISSVNMTQFAVSCGFGHIYWRNP